jgi:hypothetical protein
MLSFSISLVMISFDFYSNLRFSGVTEAEIIDETRTEIIDNVRFVKVKIAIEQLAPWIAAWCYEQPVVWVDRSASGRSVLSTAASFFKQVW